MSYIDTLHLQLKQISQVTEKRYKEVNEIGVLGGLTGIALFHFHYSKYLNDDRQSDIGVEILTHCISKINMGYSQSTYCNGIAGFGWSLQYLVDQGYIELDLEDLLTPFDPFLSSQMEFDFNHEHYDFLHGACGYGFYFLKRYLGSNNEKTKKRYKQILKQLVLGLEGLAIHEGNTIKWSSTLSHEKGNSGYNLSLSHGISSILYLLSRLFFAGIDKARTSKLIQGGVNYILENENTDGSGISLYPGWVEPERDLKYNSRLSWCYGDIGIGLALEWAGKVLNDSKLYEKAQNIFRNASTRKTPELTMVVDPGYCHGSFGNAHIFHTLYLSKNEIPYRNATHFWIQDGLRRYINADEPYLQRDPKSNSWRFELSLLEGISGIGLAMIDFLTNNENSWHECLMLK